MKTTLRLCIDEFEAIKAKGLTLKDIIYIDGVLAVLYRFIEKEKQQIINAFQSGVHHAEGYLSDDSYAQKYFNQMRYFLVIVLVLAKK